MLTSYGQREAVLIMALKQLLQNHSKLKFPFQIMVNVHTFYLYLDKLRVY